MKFKFPKQDRHKSECFVRCVLVETKIIKDSRIQPDRLFQQMKQNTAMERQGKLKEHISGCVREFKGATCTKVFAAASCLMLGFKQEAMKSFTPKVLARHTEL